MTHDSYASSDIPPVDSTTYVPVTAPSSWPGVIGWISVIYAIAGMLCGGLGQLWAMVGFSWQLSMMGIDDVDLSLPPMVRFLQIVSLIVLLSLGIYMAMGSIALIRRQAVGLVRLRRWAVLRLVWCVLGFVLALLVLPTTVDQSMLVQEAINEQMQQANPNAPQGFSPDRDMQWMMSLVGVIIGTGIAAVYPVFIGVYLSSSSKKSESETWA